MNDMKTFHKYVLCQRLQWKYKAYIEREETERKREKEKKTTTTLLQWEMRTRMKHEEFLPQKHRHGSLT